MFFNHFKNVLCSKFLSSIEKFWIQLQSSAAFACQVSSVSLNLKVFSHSLPFVFNDSDISEIPGHCLIKCSTVKTGLILQCFQFSSGAQSSLTFCKLMDCGTPGFPVYLKLLELAQVHVH